MFTGNFDGDPSSNIYVTKNICIYTMWGISCEDNSTQKHIFTDNVIALNNIGFALFHPPKKDSDPSLIKNNIWQNKKASIQKGGGATRPTKYNSQNTSQNPEFKNLHIYDLRNNFIAP